MKKLKLYGEKKIMGIFTRKGFVAEVSVVDGRVVVATKNRNLKKELEKVIAGTNVYLNKSKWWARRGGKVHSRIAEPQKPGDIMYLDALRDQRNLWRNNTFAGYSISWVLSRIIEE